MEMCPDCFGSNIKDGICGDCGFNTTEYVWEDYQLPQALKEPMPS